MRIIKIGCCGFPVSRRKYYEEHSLVELQNTFYNLPDPGWAEKLRSEAPVEFEFTVKAWQVITHSSRSPTWRRLRRRPPGKIENYGFLRPTRENINALAMTLEVARKLDSKIIVLQTPASLPYTEESIEWINEFFKIVAGLLGSDEHVGWEPRGRWAEEQGMLHEILCRHKIIHVVDIFKHQPLCMPDGIVYIRLHGLGGEVNYRYKYTDTDLQNLIKILEELEFDTAYVLFNNIHMLDDSVRFRKIIRASIKDARII